jgi:hypothetical protein
LIQPGNKTTAMELIYDIVRRDNDFVLYANGKPCLTPSGNLISHTNARLLRLCINHQMFHAERKISPFRLLEHLADAAAGSMDELGFNPDAETGNDPLLSGTGESVSRNLTVQLLHDHAGWTDFIFQTSSSIASSRTNFFLPKATGQTEAEYLKQVIREFSSEKKTALNTLYMNNGAGLTIHCLLLNEYLSLTEYTAGLIILGSGQNKSGDPGVQTEGEPAGFARLHEQLLSNHLPITDFLILCKSGNKVSVIEEMIQRGEDQQTEFKSTLRWDIRQGLKSPAIEHASLKTICAFLNSQGGDLIIGVHDDGTIGGIEVDLFGNDDRFLLHLWTLIKTTMGDEVVQWVNTTLHKFGEKTICRVNCRKAVSPVFLRQKGFDEAFFIRVGPSSSSLEISAALKYIEQHF